MEQVLLVLLLLVGIFRVARLLNRYVWKLSCKVFPRWWAKKRTLHKILFSLEK